MSTNESDQTTPQGQKAPKPKAVNCSFDPYFDLISLYANEFGMTKKELGEESVKAVLDYFRNPNDNKDRLASTLDSFKDVTDRLERMRHQLNGYRITITTQAQKIKALEEKLKKAQA